ncbi:hypothetical protein ACQJBY_048606 [Aegilops geniculata]
MVLRNATGLCYDHGHAYVMWCICFILQDGFGCAKMCLTYINCGGTNPLDRAQGAGVFSMFVGLKDDQFIYLCNLFCSTMGTQGNRSYTASTNIDIDDEDSKISCLSVGHLEAQAGGTTVGQREL